MKKRPPNSTSARRGGNPYDEPWKSEESHAPRASVPRPAPVSGMPSAEAVLARLRQQAGSLDDLIGYFKLKKLPEHAALEKRLLELGRSGQVRLDRRGRLEAAPPSAPEPEPSPAPLAAPAPVPAAPASATVPAAPRPAPKPPSRAAVAAPAVPAVPAPSRPAAAAITAVARSAAASLSRLISGPPAAEAKPPPDQPLPAPKPAPVVAAPVVMGDELSGKVSAHRDGFGFVVTEGPGQDVFLPQREMRGLMSGDRVKVRVTGIDASGRLSGEFVAMLGTAPRFVVGRLRREQGRWWVTPDNQKAQPFELSISQNDLSGASEGQVVRAEMVGLPGGRGPLAGRVSEVIGEHLAPGLEIEIALRRHDLPHEFPDEVEREAEAFGPEVRAADTAGRVDLRTLPLVTIDGIDARDFDDAVYAEKLRGGGFRLVVAIADVSAYVEPGTPLDEEATRRGTSVYFPRRVIPMLPEALSNGLCSLNPNVDRLCMVCDMKLGKDGEVSAAKFYEGVMRSQARLIYEDVSAVLAEPKGEAARALGKLVPQLQALDAAFEALFAARQQRGAIDFEGQETKFEFTDDRKIERIVPVQRTRAHRLIEECMIAANIEAAKFVSAKETPALHRVHEQPDAQRVVVLKEFLAGRALTLGGGESPMAKDFAAVTEAARGRPDTGLIHMMILRTMSQARYSPDPLGHFGLALEHYAHFTSPIRRYPDLLLHRAIKHIVKRRKPKNFTYSHEQVEALGLHCSMTERRADEATRDVASWLKCEFMSHRVGDSFEGVVSAVTAFGLFVDLKGLYIEGLVHISTLGEDHYQFDAKGQQLVGRRSGHRYQLGQPLQVQVVRVNLEERKIDLVPAVRAGKGSETVQPARQDSRRSPPNRAPAPQSNPPPGASRRSKKKRR